MTVIVKIVKFILLLHLVQGKTTLGIELIKRIDYSTLILVPSITIREQWVERICEAFLVKQENRDQYLSQEFKKTKINYCREHISTT